MSVRFLWSHLLLALCLTTRPHASDAGQTQALTHFLLFPPSHLCCFFLFTASPPPPTGCLLSLHLCLCRAHLQATPFSTLLISVLVGGSFEIPWHLTLCRVSTFIGDVHEALVGVSEVPERRQPAEVPYLTGHRGGQWSSSQGGSSGRWRGAGLLKFNVHETHLGTFLQCRARLIWAETQEPAFLTSSWVVVMRLAQVSIPLFGEQWCCQVHVKGEAARVFL